MGRERKQSSVGREAFVGTVLEMLDEGVGIRELNLRAVARRVGCAHTNAYNYFASLEDLLWWSLRGALERMVGFADPATDDLVARYIEFALEHPAWYRLVWLDPLGGPPPGEVAEFLRVPADVFARWVALRLGGGGDVELELATRVLHGYLHGELAAIVSGRVTGGPDELFGRVRSGADALVRALFTTDDSGRTE